jgi:hypothetical protein
MKNYPFFAIICWEFYPLTLNRWANNGTADIFVLSLLWTPTPSTPPQEEGQTRYRQA